MYSPPPPSSSPDDIARQQIQALVDGLIERRQAEDATAITTSVTGSDDLRYRVWVYREERPPPKLIPAGTVETDMVIRIPVLSGKGNHLVLVAQPWVPPADGPNDKYQQMLDRGFAANPYGYVVGMRLHTDPERYGQPVAGKSRRLGRHRMARGQTSQDPEDAVPYINWFPAWNTTPVEFMGWITKTEQNDEPLPERDPDAPPAPEVPM